MASSLKNIPVLEQIFGWNISSSGRYAPNFPLTRSSTAIVTNGQNQRVSAAINQPRIEHYNGNALGLMIEKSSYNLFLNSSSFTGSRTINQLVAGKYYFLSWSSGPRPSVGSSLHYKIFTTHTGRNVMIVVPSGTSVVISTTGIMTDVQFEVGHLTSYIPTGSSQILRASENIVFPNNIFEGVNAKQWSLVIGMSIINYPDIDKNKSLATVRGATGNLLFYADHHQTPNSSSLSCSLSISGESFYGGGYKKNSGWGVLSGHSLCVSVDNISKKITYGWDGFSQTRNNVSFGEFRDILFGSFSENASTNNTDSDNSTLLRSIEIYSGYSDKIALLAKLHKSRDMV